jgi:tRNA A-37 threonylcarbamoyl transferase component Bud32
MRRVVGVLIAVAALVGAAASQPRVQESARLEARDAAERAATPMRLRAQESLRAYLQRQESRALAAAALPQLRAQLALLRNHRLEGELQATLADWFRGEPEWEPFRREFRIYAVSADEGSLELVEGTDGAQLTADPLVAQARRNGVASGWLSLPGLLAASAARVAVPNRRPPAVLVLAKPLDGEALAEIGERAGGSVLLAQGNREVARAAADADILRLVEAMQSGQATTHVGADGTWAATAVSVAGDHRLWVALDASGTALAAGAAVRTTQLIIWAAGAFIALLALFFGLRRQTGGFVPASSAVTREGRPALAAPLASGPARNGPAAGGAPPGPDVQEVDSVSGLSPLPPPGGPPDQPYREQAFGRYMLLDRLGEGGMAQVYTAVIFGAEGFRRRFVIKRLRPELLNEPAVVAQFIDEANMASSLVHSNIVPVLDFGKVGDEYFLATEYILGRDLDRVTSRHRETLGTGLPLTAALFAAHETLKALEYAHTKMGPGGKPLGIVHRDVSPNNILVSARGEIKLFDFGIVKAEGRVTRTQQGVVKGNVVFMSPEQARGQEVDARADLFSLGLVLYSFLTGEPLYRGTVSYEVLLHAATGPSADDLARVRALPSPADTLIERALQVDAATRYQSAAEFLAAVAPHVGGGAAVIAEIMNRLFAEDLRREDARFVGASATAAQPLAATEVRSNVRPTS